MMESSREAAGRGGSMLSSGGPGWEAAAAVVGSYAGGKAGKPRGSGSGGWEHRACAGALGPAGTQGGLAGTWSLGAGSAWLHSARLTHSSQEQPAVELVAWPSFSLFLSLSHPIHNNSTPSHSPHSNHIPRTHP